MYKAPETFHYAAAQWESLSGRVTAQECVGTGRDGQRQSSTAESGGEEHPLSCPMCRFASEYF